jgi:hypothetical protein
LMEFESELYLQIPYPIESSAKLQTPVRIWPIQTWKD